ncbi:hypothetical protein [Bifidobacterium sp. ESL0745]|uniref:hypothetical protein n=1 Tax=Bifidobacterium sp. ESL0745 TaxID=2983226 RepID=UPI0023F888E9|nr:hypothetical protein [Bifidobacterium sp. ESL0745]MDF7665743.1 hypothetical protein [Bifidobacterium sp. ESL0745]
MTGLGRRVRLKLMGGTAGTLISGSVSTKVATLPEWARPAHTVSEFVPWSAQSGTGVVLLGINTDGTVGLTSWWTATVAPKDLIVEYPLD